jgi:hypothetical protein
VRTGHQTVGSFEAGMHRRFIRQAGDDQIALPRELGRGGNQRAANANKVFRARATHSENPVPLLQQILACSATDFAEPENADGWLHVRLHSFHKPQLVAQNARFKWLPFR